MDGSVFIWKGFVEYLKTRNCDHTGAHVDVVGAGHQQPTEFGLGISTLNDTLDA